MTEVTKTKNAWPFLSLRTILSLLKNLLIFGEFYYCVWKREIRNLLNNLVELMIGETIESRESPKLQIEDVLGVRYESCRISISTH